MGDVDELNSALGVLLAEAPAECATRSRPCSRTCSTWAAS
jgi:hypothetical protein